MKNLKKLAGLLLALVLIMSLTTTAFAAEGTAYSITINNTETGHTYEAYQIFKGDISGTGTSDPYVLSNIAWGDNVDLKEEYKDAVAAEIAERLNTAYTGNDKLTIDELLDMFTLNGNPAGTSSTQKDNAYVISELEAGYYLVKDKNNSLGNAYDFYTDFIIKVVGDTSATPKGDKPSVDKQVHDEPADAEGSNNTTGWGETADHAINEIFEFKLTATLGKNATYDEYETYKVIFHDTMSKGVTFDKLVSVKVNGNDVGAWNEQINQNGYVMSPITTDESSGNRSFDIEIKNIKAYLGENKKLSEGATIEVIYKAHLNEDAVMASSDDNQNKVNLEYSNNPNASGDTGKTPDDTVYVFTYEMPNTKVQPDGENTKPLEGAGFRLYTDEACENEVFLVKGDDGFYRPAANDAISGDEMISGADGKFNIKGLDAGTYYLKETTTPEGFNTCPIAKIVITATHSENEDNASATTTFSMTMNGATSNNNQILNQKGAQLPETGGIGTTIFYIVGGLLMVGAAVLLVTKKRMGSAE